METPALASLLEARIKLKIEELERLERDLNILKIELSNDIKTLEKIIIYAKDFGLTGRES